VRDSGDRVPAIHIARLEDRRSLKRDHQAYTRNTVVTEHRRELTDTELLVLGEVQAYWGAQNKIDRVFFTDRDEAGLFVRDRDGKSPVMLVLTNLGAWYRDGTLSLEALRQQIKGPDARP
jgi:hypothetical protein